jgi:hypothetical protein
MPRPGRITPGKENRYPFYRRLGGPQGKSGHVRKISPLPGFDHRTIQSVASRYTRYLKQQKVKVKVNFTLEQATKAQSGSRDIALLFL